MHLQRLYDTTLRDTLENNRVRCCQESIEHVVEAHPLRLRVVLNRSSDFVTELCLEVLVLHRFVFYFVLIIFGLDTSSFRRSFFVFRFAGGARCPSLGHGLTLSRPRVSDGKCDRLTRCARQPLTRLQVGRGVTIRDVTVTGTICDSTHHAPFVRRSSLRSLLPSFISQTCFAV